MRNSEIAAVFYEIADLLELQEVAFKPQAYRRAAAAIEQLDVDISEAVERGEHKDIPGVGKAIAKKIEELVSTGELRYLDQLRSEMPPGLIQMMKIPDVGPKTAVLLYRELGISSVEDLKKAAEDHRVRDLKGLGEKTEKRIIQGIETLESKGDRTLLGEALPVAEAYVDYLRKELSTDMISICGSLRRGRDTIGDIDILVGGSRKATEVFLDYPEVERVLLSGETKSSVRLGRGMQADLRVVEEGNYGAALQYFTGSKEHNVQIRKLGQDKGLKVNEYGVFERDSGDRIAGETEEGIYEALGLAFIPPEMREDSGEIEASRRGDIPKLVEPEDVRGDFHIHSDWSDGADSIEDIALAAADKGYGFVAITDHTEGLSIANGLSPERLEEQIDVVRKVEDDMEGEIRILAGTEVDIRRDGTLDMPDSVLEELDVVIASVHSKLRMERDEMTERLVSAMGTGMVDILGHPTGRIIGRRDPMAFDVQRVFEAAAEGGVAMEINSFPDRLDLKDSHCRLAKEAGLTLAIGTDAHSLRHLDYLRLGVITARRGWLSAGDVLNTHADSDMSRRLGGGSG